MLRSTLLVLTGQLAPLIAAVLCMPAVVRAYGPDRVGLLSLVLAIVSYFALLDLGLSRALTRAVAEAMGDKRPESVPGIFWSALAAQSALGLVGTILIVLGTPLIAGKLLNTPDHLHSEATATLIIAGLSLPIVLASSSATGFLQAAGRFDRLAFVQVPTGVANYLLPLVISGFTKDLANLMGALFALRLLALLALFLQARAVFPDLRNRRFSRKELQPLLRFGGWITVTGVVGPLLVYADRFVIGSQLSMADVAYYSVPADIATRMLIIPTAMSQALFPLFSQESTSKEMPGRGGLVADTTRYILCLIGVPAAIGSGYSFDLLAVWMGPEFAAHAGLNLRILLVGIVINAVAYVPLTLIQARGRPDLSARLHLAELPLYLCAVWIGAIHWGIAGVAAAWVLRVMVDTSVLSVMVVRVGPVEKGTFADTRLRSAVLLVGATWTAALAGAMLQDRAQRLALAGGVLGMATLLAWRFVVSRPERERLLRPIRSILQRPS